MIISDISGDFKLNFDSRKFARAIPIVASMISEIRAHPEYIKALNFFYELGIPVSSDFSLNPKNRNNFNFKRTGELTLNVSELIREKVDAGARAARRVGRIAIRRVCPAGSNTPPSRECAISPRRFRWVLLNIW
jgi:hypothetical protein